MSESINEVDGLRRKDGTDSVKVEVKEEEKTEQGEVAKKRRMGGIRHHAGKRYNDTIIKYKRWNTYYGDYGSFPYI